MRFNCLTVTEPLRGDSLLFMTNVKLRDNMKKFYLHLYKTYDH